MSAPQLFQSYGCQYLVSELTRRTTIKLQYSDMYSTCFSHTSGYQLQMVTTLDMRWKGNRRKGPQYVPNQYHAIELYEAYSNLLQLCMSHTLFRPLSDTYKTKHLERHTMSVSHPSKTDEDTIFHNINQCASMESNFYQLSFGVYVNLALQAV